MQILDRENYLLMALNVSETINGIKSTSAYNLSHSQLNCRTDTNKMKLGFYFYFLLFNLVSSSSALKCYQCNDHFPSFLCANETSVTNCLQGEDLCATAYIKNKKNHPMYECGEKEFCVQKVCARRDPHFCKDSGTFEAVNISNDTFTIECCEGDLCNKG